MKIVHPLNSEKADDVDVDNTKRTAPVGLTDREIDPPAGDLASLEGLVAYMVKRLVDNPDKVEVVKIEGAHITVLEVRVDKHDAGQVIGRQGRTADALRTILSAVATKNKKRVMLDIID